MGRRSVAFDSNVVDLYPGQIFQIERPPHGALAEASKLLVTESTLEGTPEGEWTLSGRAVFADVPYLPPQRTPRPVVDGVQSATVVGPKGQEIHTDEFGRVRVQFPWGSGPEDTISMTADVTRDRGQAGENRFQKTPATPKVVLSCEILRSGRIVHPGDLFEALESTGACVS